MLAIGDPLAGSAGVFAWGDRRRVANQGDELALTFDFQAQNTEAVLLVVEGDSLYEAGDAFKCCRIDFGHVS